MSPNKKHWAEQLLSHIYPPIVLKYPRLIHLLYLWHRLITLRVWHVRSELIQLMKSEPKWVAEVGVGEGLYMDFIMRRRPSIRFLAIDKHLPHILFLNTLRSTKRNRARISLYYQNAAVLELLECIDVMLCIGVLQYIEDDDNAIRQMYRVLRPGGYLLIYVPINGRSYLPGFTQFFQASPNYEQLQGRKRIYKKNNILNKLQQAGFIVEKEKFTYGKWGVISYEIYQSFLLFILHRSIWLKILASLGLIICLPFLWIMMGIDYYKVHTEGNGLCIVVKKG